MSQHVSCPNIVCPESLRIGKYTNAFRILPDGQEILLDFATYSQREGKAVVSVRLRASPQMLQAIMEQIRVFEATRAAEAGPPSGTTMSAALPAAPEDLN